jgi:hypothetical protein
MATGTTAGTKIDRVAKLRQSVKDKEAELKRMRKALKAEEGYLLRLLAKDNLMRGDIQGAFHRIREGE